MAKKKARFKVGLTCNRPDRDVPGIKCGHPLPCPHHTVVIDDLLVGEPRFAKLGLKQRRALHDIAYAITAAREAGRKGR